MNAERAASPLEWTNEQIKRSAKIAAMSGTEQAWEDMCHLARELATELSASEARFKDWSGTDVPALNIALTNARAELSAAREQVAALEGRNFELESLHGQISAAFTNTSNRALNAEAALAACRKDAARYQWLRENGRQVQGEIRNIECDLLPGGEHFASLDVAIDAAIAMSAQGPT